MLEAKLDQAGTLKKIVDAMKDMVEEANFDCSSDGIALQCMDSSRVSLVALLLRADGFSHFRCDKNRTLGISVVSMAKILKCANNDDTLTIKAEDDSDSILFVFESAKQDKISSFELKLMNLDIDRLGIPDVEHDALIKMPSVEFQRICRDLSILSNDTVIVSTKKGRVSFACDGEVGSGEIVLKQTTDIDAKPEEITTIDIKEPLTQRFSIRYFNYFTKATTLSPHVQLQISLTKPIAVHYRIENLGYIRYYLAPKIEEAPKDVVKSEK